MVNWYGYGYILCFLFHGYRKISWIYFNFFRTGIQIPIWRLRVKKDRVKLLPKNVEMLLFVKCNLRVVSCSTSLPSAPEQFTKPNSKIYDNIQENSESEDLSG